MEQQNFVQQIVDFTTKERASFAKMTKGEEYQVKQGIADYVSGVRIEKPGSGAYALGYTYACAAAEAEVPSCYYSPYITKHIGAVDRFAGRLIQKYINDSPSCIEMNILLGYTKKILKGVALINEYDDFFTCCQQENFITRFAQGIDACSRTDKIECIPAPSWSEKDKLARDDYFASMPQRFRNLDKTVRDVLPLHVRQSIQYLGFATQIQYVFSYIYWGSHIGLNAFISEQINTLLALLEQPSCLF